METLPPLLHSAIEALEHGIEHFLEGGDRDRRFAFLHVDNAVELLLKEKVRQLGRSIWKKNGKTIGVWGAYKILEEEKIDIPHKSHLENVHHERNSIQHKGVTPDESTTQVYLGEVFPFFEEFSEKCLAVKIDEHISPEIMDILRKVSEKLLKDVPKTAPDLLIDAEMYVSTNPGHSVVTASTAVELVAKEYAASSGFEDRMGRPQVTSFLKDLSEKGLLDSAEVNKREKIRAMRNNVIHNGYEPSEEEAKMAVESSRSIVDSWSSLSEQKKKPKAR